VSRRKAQGEFKVKVQKHHKNIFTEVHVEKKIKIKIFDKNFDVSFSSIFFVLSFIAFSGVLCVFSFQRTAMGVQKHYKKRLPKKIVSKSFLQKIRPKIQNRLLLEFFFITFFGRFSMRGVQKLLRATSCLGAHLSFAL
jgi:hypothetical protein